MTVFKNSKEYKQIYDFLKKENVLKEQAIFQCYTDLMFDYKLELNDKVYFFTILAEEENFVCEQEIEWLIDLQRVCYFEFVCGDFQVVFNLNNYVN